MMMVFTLVIFTHMQGTSLSHTHSLSELEKENQTHDPVKQTQAQPNTL